MSRRSADEMVAHGLEMDARLLPIAAELLQDLDALGSEPHLVAALLAAHGIGPGDLVIDLGCGKGGMSVTLAERLGCEVRAIDLFEPFLQHTRERVAAAGLSDRVTVERGDASQPPDQPIRAAALIYGAMGDLLGTLDRTVATLRAWVGPGALIVIDDSVMLHDPDPDHPLFGAYVDLPASRARLTACGDVLVHEQLVDDDDGGAEAETLRRRARALAAEHPDYAGLLQDFIDEQLGAYAFLEAEMTGVIWALRRADHG